MAPTEVPAKWDRCTAIVPMVTDVTNAKHKKVSLPEHRAPHCSERQLRNFGRPRWADHLNSVQNQPGQHGEILCLLQIQKLAWHDGSGCRLCPTLTPSTATFLLMAGSSHPPPPHTHLEEEGAGDVCHFCQDNLPPGSQQQVASLNRETGFCPISQTSMQRCDHSSLQTQTPGLKRASFVSLPSRYRDHYIIRAGLKILASKDPPTSSSQKTPYWSASSILSEMFMNIHYQLGCWGRTGVCPRATPKDQKPYSQSERGCALDSRKLTLLCRPLKPRIGAPWDSRGGGRRAVEQASDGAG
ncbi:hypothetical protein AAY473_021637 [Plecturocebus cupreus]